MPAKEAINKLATGATPYDVLGYLMPGGAAVLSCFFFEFWLRRVGGLGVDDALLPAYALFREVAHGLESSSWAISAIFFVIALGGIYIIGHVIASVSALLIERQLVRKGHGYPFDRLLGVHDTTRLPVSKPFYRAMFLWLNVYLLLRYAHVAVRPLPDYDVLPWLLPAATAIGWLMIGLLLVKLLLSDKHVAEYHKYSPWQPRLRRIGIAIVRVFAAPYDLTTNTVERTLGLHAPFAPTICNAFVEAMRKQHGLTPDSWGSDAYWLSYIHVRNAGSALADPAENWLRLYAFARNLAVALYLAFLYCYAVLAWNDIRLVEPNPAYVTVLIPLLFWLGAVIMLSRYYYLYSSYYTKYVIRAYVFSCADTNQGVAAEAR